MYYKYIQNIKYKIHTNISYKQKTQQTKNKHV
jgi:hypothetical protein